MASARKENLAAIGSVDPKLKHLIDGGDLIVCEYGVIHSVYVEVYRCSKCGETFNVSDYECIGIPVKVMIDAFVSLHPTAYNVAHSVLDDYNLGDDSIRFALDVWIPENRDEYAKTFNVSQAEIDEVVTFLNKLLEISEDDRDVINA